MTDRNIAGNLGFNKLTLIFPPGDQLTSVLIEKEKDNKLDDLINRLCTLRGIDLTKLKKVKILDHEGKKVDLNQTVGESSLPFIEIIDKTTEKEKKKEKKEQDKHKIRDRPSNVKIEVGKNCYVPIEEQLFDDEKASLHAAKQLENAKYFSDEFILAILFARKFDLKRTEEFLNASLVWRREHGFMNIPRLSELDLNLFHISASLTGSRDKLGRSIRYIRMNQVIPNVEPFTVEKLTKLAVWFAFVGIFHEGIDALRNGICLVGQLEGYGWKNYDIDFQRQMAPIWADKFPVLLRKVYLLNQPSIFTAVLKIMSTFTKNKIIDRVEAVTTKDLQKAIEPDNLLAEFGGNNNFSSEDWKNNLVEWAEKCEERLIAPGRDCK